MVSVIFSDDFRLLDKWPFWYRIWRRRNKKPRKLTNRMTIQEAIKVPRERYTRVFFSENYLVDFRSGTVEFDRKFHFRLLSYLRYRMLNPRNRLLLQTQQLHQMTVSRCPKVHRVSRRLNRGFRRKFWAWCEYYKRLFISTHVVIAIRKT